MERDAGIGPPKHVTLATVEDAITRIASRQHGVVARVQLLEAGLSPDVIDRRLGSGRLHRVHRGVYRAAPVRARYAREMAAVLACGGGAVVSHRSAAVIWQLLRRPDENAPVDLILDGGRETRRPGIRAHRVRRPRPDEVTEIGGLRVTKPARTLLDLASVCGLRELERALAQAERQRLASGRDVELLLARYPRWYGAGKLRAITQAADPAGTRSKAEKELLSLISKAELSKPKVNTIVEGFEVDFFWPAEGLIVEMDGYEFHSSRRTFESDRRRDGLLTAAGLRVMRVTWRQTVNQPTAVAARIAQALARGAR